ncbi:MAG: ABC transporter substrate-binding protein [Coriobacteriales bacterium]|nr:ABC transporter substrate-binding protein [Coriobacteriales bacterium]MBQ6585681.1 ABC transporter substrate-binding protein [Coriobacteriales bacterium]
MRFRLHLIIALACVMALFTFVLTGCGGNDPKPEPGESGDLPHITIGTLATEDILPMWVAQNEGAFEAAGLKVDIQVFQSATELIAGVTSGQVDVAMTDPMVTASIHASGTPVRICWVTLGTTASQGRFGIMTSDPNIKTLQDLAGVEIGVGSNTILEYVMDCLMEDAGIPADQVKKSELQKLPVRYEAMASGQVKAAALPGSLLALGEASGFHTVADDSSGRNISQSVMIVREDWLAKPGAAEALDKLADTWDASAANINANPEAYRDLLVSKANLPEVVAATYPISTYPSCQLPSQQMIDDVLDWMDAKGYLTQPLKYNASDGSFTIADQ